MIFRRKDQPKKIRAKRKTARTSRPGRNKAKVKKTLNKPHFSRPSGLHRLPFTRYDWFGGMGLLALAGLLFVPALGALGLVEGAETRLAETAREMLVSRDVITPRLNMLPYLEHPPLAPILSAAAMSLLGTGEFAARLPSSMLAGLCVLAVAWLGRSMAGRREGVFAGLALMSLPLFWSMARSLNVEMGLVLGAVVAMQGLWRTRIDRQADSGPLLFWLGAGLGFLAKGAWGLLLPWTGAGVFALVSGEWRLLRRLISWQGVLIFFIMAAPWLILLEVFTPGAFLHWIWDWGAGLKPSIEVRARGWGLLALVGGAWPWLGILSWAWLRLWPRGSWNQEPHRGWLFLLAWGGSSTLLALALGAPAPLLALAACPPLALFVGRALAELDFSNGGKMAPHLLRRVAIGTAALALALGPGLFLIVAGSEWLSYRLLGSFLLFGPLAAVLAGLWIFRLRHRNQVALAGPLLVFLLCALFWVVTSSLNQPTRSLKGLLLPLAGELKSADSIVQYQGYSAGASFYTGKRILVVGNPRILAWGRMHQTGSAGWFSPPKRPFVRLLQNPKKRVFVLAERGEWLRIKEDLEGTPGLLLFPWQSQGGRTVFSNRPR